MVNTDWENLIDEEAAVLFLDVVSYPDLVIYFNYNIDAESEFLERNHGPSIVLDDAFKGALKDDHSPLVELYSLLDGGDEIGWDRASRRLNLMARQVMRRRLGMAPLSEEEKHAFCAADRVKFICPINLDYSAGFDAVERSSDELDRIAKLVDEKLPQILEYVRLCKTYSRQQGYTDYRIVGEAVQVGYYIMSAELSLFPRSSGYFLDSYEVLERLL